MLWKPLAWLLFHDQVKKNNTDNVERTSRNLTTPSDLILVSLLWTALKIVLRGEDDADCETGWESLLK